MTQSEYSLEQSLIEQLMEMQFAPVKIGGDSDMLANLRKQLGKHNDITFSDEEFARVLAHLNTGNVFERARILRDKYALKRDNNETVYIEFFDCQDWCKNEMQVSSQISAEGKRKNRYDVTLLFNGLPLVQIELKKRGTELKAAFNQINRYQHESYDANYGLFQYVQIFVISNGVNTRYFANNRTQHYQFTFTWADIENRRINDLAEFTATFLKPCHITKMISHYMVLAEQEDPKTKQLAKTLLVMRPYQVYATEAIINSVKTSTENGYIWHTTGSGKTLTAFKASQVIMHMPKVHKVLFVVDRKDLDYQTAREFNSFAKGSVDPTSNTSTLVKQLNDPNAKLIVTTIQKLNTALTKDRHLTKINHLQDEKFVLIFDECHRSQFGETHKNIIKFFGNSQLFGFTGTPIFEKNAINKNGLRQTTKDLFDKPLHKYVIVDAIRDGNVLPFSVEYIGTTPSPKSQLDIEVSTDENPAILEHPSRLKKIAEYILEHHKQKTKAPHFTGMFCVSSIDALVQYYHLFKTLQADTEKPLKVATIFSYAANPEVVHDEEQHGYIADEVIDSDTFIGKLSQGHRDSLDSFIADYNATFGTSFSTKDSQSFYNYYNDIARRVKRREIDILLVVNMFLTGFDSKYLNTLYVDKNLRFHGLIQAFSRTNRVVDGKKSHGNIVCFRDLKDATDEAVALFSDKNAKEDVQVKPYHEYVEEFNKLAKGFLSLVPTVQSVDELADENAEKSFIEKFRALLRLKNILTTFVDYEPADIAIDEQDFADYTSKYLDLYEKFRKPTEEGKPPVTDEIDFELELVHRDEINVAYIVALLARLAKTKDVSEFEKLKKEITNLLASEIQLRGKRDLIMNFMDKHLLLIPVEDSLEEVFAEYFDEEKEKALKAICQEENLNEDAITELLNHYIFSGTYPRQNQLIQALNNKISIKLRKATYARIDDKIKAFIDTFIDGMGGIV